MLAIVNVMIIKGAIAVAELSGIFVQPSAPRDTNAAMIAMNKIEATPVAERNSNPTTSNIATSIAGVKVAPSCWLEFENCAPIAILPVEEKSMSGYLALKVASIGSTSAMTSGISFARSRPGRRKMIATGETELFLSIS